jgi:two-component system sensor histidine kinase YesM
MKRKFFLKNLGLFLIPLMIPLLILGTFSILISQRFIRENVEKSNMSTLVQSKENMEMMLKEIDSLSLNFESDPVIAKRLKEILSADDYSLDAMESIDFIKNYVDVPANSKQYIHSIYVYYNNKYNRFISSTNALVQLSEYNDRSWYDSYLKNRDSGVLWSEARDVRVYEIDKKPTPVVTIYKNLYSTGSQRSTGVVVLNILTSYVENILNQLATFENQSIFVVNASNDILFRNKAQPYLERIDIPDLLRQGKQFFSIEVEGEVFTVSAIRSEQYGWSYLSIVPQKSLYKLPSSLIAFTFYLLILCAVLGFLLSIYFTRKNYNRISSIISILESAENGRALPAMTSRVKDEYGFIIQNILKTFIEQSYLKVQLSERKYRMQAMELIALQSQINPHFLFNTLHTIYWEVLNLSGKPNIANQMISNLTDILEYSLSDPNDSVSLGEEIKYTQSYIDIQKIRYRDKFRFIWEYDEEIKGSRVIKLLLQPLIENSIYHGIKQKEEKGSIKVKIWRCGPELKFSVIDSGVGMERDELEKIKEALAKADDFSRHIGLFNTHKRLLLRYGDGYAIRILSKKGLGTAVQISIPVTLQIP